MDYTVNFITYTKGATMFVTSTMYESHFLDWLNTVDNSSGYVREVASQVGVRCAPRQVHQTEKREATVLSLVQKGEQ